MGEFEQTVENVIKKVAGKIAIKQTLTGVAKNVRDNLCDVERDGSPTLLDARLNAIDDDLQSYVTVTPKEDSNVIVGIIENLKTEAVILRCSEVEKVKLKIGEQTLTIDKDGFIFNKGENGGLLIDKKVNDNLTKLKNYINAYEIAVKAGFTALDAVLSGLGTAGNTAIQAAMAGQSIIFEDMKNSKITH